MTQFSRETEALLELGRAGMPLTSAHRERLRGAVLAKAAGAAVVTTAGSAAAWTSLGTKIVGAVALVVVTGGAGLALGNRVPDRPFASLATSRGADHGTRATRGLSSQTQTAIPNAMAPQTATTTQDPFTTPALRSIPASMSIRPSTWVPTAIQAPIGRSTSRPVAAAARSNVPAAATLPVSTVPTLESDVRLLREADLATNAGDPERALALLDEHAATFPRSDLEPERSAERVFALCRGGRIDDARSARGTFLNAHPTGPLAVRVKAACGGKPAE